MKKYLILFFIIISTLKVAAESGDGSLGNPFYGTILTNVQWSVSSPIYGSTVYVGTLANPDLTVGSGGHLTIDPGITVIFTQLSSDLIIKGSGILTANGNSSNLITFTKATGKGHWGHISFETPGTSTPITGTGSFKYCHVEYGYAVTVGQNPDNGGGGIQVNARNVTIENCSFNNNKSSYGGAVGVNSNMNTLILNCVFFSNNAPIAAGALLIRNGATSIVENCIFNQNTCDGAGASLYSGGAIWLYSNTAKIINNTFYLNTTKPAYTGDAIYSYSSSGSVIINSVFWGSNDQVAYFGTSPGISFCAFQTAKPASATNSLILSGVAGDHFTNPGGGDLSLLFISPCRDAGTTPTPSVPNDFLGNPRIGAYDIGAYEVQYSRWTGATNTDWTYATNWEASVDPSTGTGDVIIPSSLPNYPIGSTSLDFTIGSGKYLILNPGAKATFNSLTTTGTLKLESDASGISSLIANNSGVTATVELYLPGQELTGINNWHYISSPVSSLAVSTFSPIPTKDLAQFVESLPTPDNAGLVEGWIAYDGFSYALQGFPVPLAHTFNSLSLGQGYNYIHTVNYKYTFSGNLNTSDVAITLAYTGTPNSLLHGFNLLGNPFSSGLNWDAIVNSVYFPYPSYTSKTLYFTRNNAQCSYAAGVGIPVDVTEIIPPMQGFFNKTNIAGNTITIPAAARVQNNIHARYKGLQIIPLVRLSFAEGAISDETVVRFDATAKSDLDYDFDALKMFLSATTTSIYSSLSGTNYAINGLPFPDTFFEIPIVVNLTSNGNHNISTTQLQGLDNYAVTLTDKTTGFIADLKTTPVLSFSASAGTITDRFVLKIGTITTGVENPAATKNTFNIYSSNNFINIQTISDDWDGKSGSVKVLDLAGKTVTDMQNTEFSRNSIVQVPGAGLKGMYVVEIRSGVMRYVGKIVIR